MSYNVASVQHEPISVNSSTFTSLGEFGCHRVEITNTSGVNLYVQLKGATAYYTLATGTSKIFRTDGNADQLALKAASGGPFTIQTEKY